VGAAALYLYDSALLLWQNELVLQHTSRGWIVLGGSELRLAGRRVFLPHPLLPQRPQFQVCWSKGDISDRGAELPSDLLRALRPIGWLNLLQVLLLIALPVVLWGVGTGFMALGVFGLFYLASFVALGLAWRRRQRLALGTGNFWLLALDALACAPFAANLTRKLAMRHGLAGEPLRFAARHFDDAALAHTRHLVEARVREEYADPDAASRGAEVLDLVLSRLAR
jgi:hypothetical protein